MGTREVTIGNGRTFEESKEYIELPEINMIDEMLLAKRNNKLPKGKKVSLRFLDDIYEDLV